MPPLQLPITAEMVVAPGPSNFAETRRADSGSHSEEQTQRIHVAEGTEAEGTHNYRDGGRQIGPHSDSRGGNPETGRGPRVRVMYENGRSSWCCMIPDCLAVIPDSHTPAGIHHVEYHINNHYLHNPSSRSDILISTIGWYLRVSHSAARGEQVEPNQIYLTLAVAGRLCNLHRIMTPRIRR
ncbi:hypothetical protein HOY80DRAFT_1036946 [Tuber brumale]|nr:hypothetical protein HOY80DRAFT_1036946 [Tuber brumale]